MPGPFLRCRRCAWGALILLFGAWSADSAVGGELVVRSDFPGGSADVQQVDQATRTIRVDPVPHKDRGWVCWWYFHVAGIEPGETLVLDVGKGVWATPTRAAVSTDNRTWTQTEAGTREKDRIVYRHKVEAREAWFAWGPPFVPNDAQELVDRLAKQSPHATAFELCRTREGRPVPALRVEEPGVADADRYGLWVQARQHAWESGGSWVGVGFAEWLVSGDPRATALRRKSCVVFVPIMDVDNVFRGAGGKNEKPQDHNRDWSDQPHWRSVEAAQTEILRMNADGRFDFFIDLHNPDAGSQRPFFFVPPADILQPIGQRNLAAFLAAAKTEMTGPLRFTGDTKVSGPNYDKLAWKAISKNWVTLHTRPHVVSTTLETAWNTPDSTQSGYRQLGRELGLALELWLREPIRRP